MFCLDEAKTYISTLFIDYLGNLNDLFMQYSDKIYAATICNSVSNISDCAVPYVHSGYLQSSAIYEYLLISDVPQLVDYSQKITVQLPVTVSLQLSLS